MRVLISGKGSYIGENFKNWLSEHLTPDVEELDLIEDDWRSFDFSRFDTVIHVAAIVHKKSKIPWETYKKVNVDLTLEVARAAKQLGVRQFIFLSTMAVYGKEKALSGTTEINENTSLNPISFYAKSKLQAELFLRELEDSDFKVAIIRPPNVYGIQCKGNYITGFLKLTKILPIFPDAFNKYKQSMLYIDNLSELVRLIIINQSNQTFMPQDDRAVSAVEIIEIMANAIGKRMLFPRSAGLGVKCIALFPIVKRYVRKVYGGVYYSGQLSRTDIGNYVIVSIDDALKRTVMQLR